MTDVAHALYIKYGLGRRPSDDEVRRWRDATEALVRSGVGPDEAGRRAAKQIFADYGLYSYKSEADTIEMLLMKAKEK